MSRRPLRKIDPALDLSKHLLEIEALPRPFSSETVFGRQAPFEIEVGSGKGLFLTQAAESCPTHDFLGIEIAAKYAHYCAAKFARRKLSNARLVHGNSQRLFTEILRDASVAAVHVYFPDPWWKKRHKKRRVLNEIFLKNAQRVLVPGGILHFWTDVEEYFQTTLALVAEATSLAGPFSVVESVAQHDLDFRTHFERRTRLHGEAVYRAEFRKLV